MPNGRPTITTLCGSTRFKDDWLVVGRYLALEGNIVISVDIFAHSEWTEYSQTEKAWLDVLHLAKIDLADRIVVINREGYIGESTEREIEYAKMRGKMVLYVFMENAGEWVPHYYFRSAYGGKSVPIPSTPPPQPPSRKGE